MLTIQKPAIRIENAQLAYGDSPALAGLTFDLYPGELLGLLGPNGAGKTTTINCLAGRQKLTHGGIQFAENGRLADQLGIVPQEIAIYSDLTVAQNLTAFGRLHGVHGSTLKQRVAEALSWAALEARRHELVSTLSGGMQRRLNIACSVLHQPTILLLDEPTVGIDPQSRERIYAMLDALLERGTAILLTTHQLDEAQSRCDRIAIIDRGRIVASGTFEELLESTISTSQQLSLKFSEPQVQVPSPLSLSKDGFEAAGFIDGSVQLTSLLAHFNSNHVSIATIAMREPTLQQLFLHLTGKELRE